MSVPCFFCGGQIVTLFRCKSCRVACYCSPECQTKHWETHNRLCITVSKGEEEDKPAITNQLGLDSQVHHVLSMIATKRFTMLGHHHLQAVLSKTGDTVTIHVPGVGVNLPLPTGVDASRPQTPAYLVLGANSLLPVTTWDVHPTPCDKRLLNELDHHKTHVFVRLPSIFPNTRSSPTWEVREKETGNVVYLIP